MLGLRSRHFARRWRAAMLGMPAAQNQRLARQRTTNARSGMRNRDPKARRTRPFVDERGCDYVFDCQAIRLK